MDPKVPDSCRVPGLGFVTQNCSPEANCQVNLGGILQPHRHGREKCWRHLEGLGRGEYPPRHLLLWKKEIWKEEREGGKMSSTPAHSEGVKHIN